MHGLPLLFFRARAGENSRKATISWNSIRLFAVEEQVIARSASDEAIPREAEIASLLSVARNDTSASLNAISLQTHETGST